MIGQGRAMHHCVGSFVAERRTPSADPLDDRLETVVNIELVSRQTGEPAQHLQEDLAAEATILRSGKFTEVLQAEPRFERGEVDEVTGLRPSEHRQHFVDCQFGCRVLRPRAREFLRLVEQSEPVENRGHELLVHILRGPMGSVEDSPAAPAHGSSLRRPRRYNRVRRRRVASGRL